MVSVRKKEGETSSSLLYRFSKKVRQSGILREVRKKRFFRRPLNKTKRKSAAIYRFGKRKEVEEAKKMGLF